MKTKGSIIIILLSAFYLFSCNKKQTKTDFSSNKEILKINKNYSLTVSEFREQSKHLHELTNYSSEMSKIETLKSFIYNSFLLEIISENCPDKTFNDNIDLQTQNRNDLINLSKLELTKNINISKVKVKKEFNRYKNKQIVIDLIWLPKYNKQLMDEWYNFLDNGGNIVDMLYSDNKYFIKILNNHGKIERINVIPGTFPKKISKYISKTEKEKVKIFNLKKEGCYLVKITNTKEDTHTWNLEEVVLNLKVQKYLNKNGIRNILKADSINLKALNCADLSVTRLNEESDVLVKFFDKEYTQNDIKNIIDTISFNDKLFFINKSTLSNALVSLILIINNNQPLTTLDFINELKTTKIHKNASNHFVYKFLTQYENSSIYPWLFPFLFEQNENVKINTKLLKEIELVDYKRVDKNEIVAFSKSDSMTISDFYSIMSTASDETIKPLMEYHNAVRLIHYYFLNTMNIQANNVIIKEETLKNCLYNYCKNLSFDNFTYGILSIPGIERKRMVYPENELLFKSNEINLTLKDLQSLISFYPKYVENMLKCDNLSYNKFWRINVITKIIEDEFWIRKAKEIKLDTTKIYQQMLTKNSNSIILKQFLNSDTITYDRLSKLDKLIKSKTENQNFEIIVDTPFFKRELPLLFDDSFNFLSILE